MLSDKERLKELTEEIELLIRYGVPAAEQSLALDLLHSFAEDLFGLLVLRDFYRTLPEAREEALRRISVLEEREQVFLLLLSTDSHHYFYVTNDEEGLFLGEWEEGLSDPQVLNFFGYPDAAAFKKGHSDLGGFREYVALERINEEVCPSCGVRSGELHTFGCPIEVCPWCGGQLNHCNCRFEQLDVEELTDEKMLEELEGKLMKKGRIPYSKEQRPGFMTDPSTSSGNDA